MKAQLAATKARWAVAEIETPVFQQWGTTVRPCVRHVADDFGLADAADAADVGLYDLNAGLHQLRELKAGGKPFAVRDRHRGLCGYSGDLVQIVRPDRGLEKEAVEFGPILIVARQVSASFQR